jgi:hypothetical protein
MRRFVLPVLAIAIAIAACESDDSVMDPPVDNGGGPEVDMTSFTGCWHVTSGTTAFGSGRCRATLDSILRILEVEAGDSLFAAIDTVTHFSLVPPYYGAGDFSGTHVARDGGSITATYHHLAGDCSLTTLIAGSVSPDPDGDEFSASYTVEIRFSGGDACSELGSCGGYVTFSCIRRPTETCEIP